MRRDWKDEAYGWLFGLACCLLGLWFAAIANAEYEAIKDWEEPLICWKVDIAGQRTGESVKLLWNNFLTFDENGKMVFLKLNEGLHTVPSKGWICLPESLDE